MLTQDKVRHLFSYYEKTGVLKWKNPLKYSNVRRGDVAGSKDSNGYLLVSIGCRRYKVHRIIWLGMKGYLPENDIDHRDRNRANNKWKNLREISRQCNIRNCGMLKNNTSGVKGVHWNKTKCKWVSKIIVNKKVKYLGAYSDFDNAVCARLAAEQCLNWAVCDSNSSAFEYVSKNILFLE